MIATSSRFVVALLLAVSPVSGQIVGGAWEVRHEFDGFSQGLAAYDYFGESVDSVGDIDGDGLADLIVGARHADPGGRVRAGSVFVYSGSSGVLLFRFDGSIAEGRFGTSVAGAGDVDGDGVPDLAVGAPGHILVPHPSAFIYSGATGNLIHQFTYGTGADDQFGVSVAGAGDVDGDGHGDLIVGGPQADLPGQLDAGVALVYSGATGNALYTFQGTAGIQLGWSVAGAGDVDADGSPDLVVGAPHADPAGVAGAGSCMVFSGATGVLLHRWDGNYFGGILGFSVDGAGDADGDGHTDLIVGAPTAFGSGRSILYSGATGQVLQTHMGSIDGAQGVYHGGSVAGVGDVDGDGYDDHLVGAMFDSLGGTLPWQGSARLYSGATGALLHVHFGSAQGGRLGSAVAGGDLNGDGIPDLVTGAPDGGANGGGSVEVTVLAPFLDLDVAVLSASGGGVARLDLDFPASEAGARYAVLASLAGTGPVVLGGLPVPLAMDPLLQQLAQGAAPALLQGAYGFLDMQGEASASLQAAPSLSGVAGQTIHFAAVTFDTGPAAGRLSSIVRYLSIVP